jgi:hypothetical protein
MAARAMASRSLGDVRMRRRRWEPVNERALASKVPSRAMSLAYRGDEWLSFGVCVRLADTFFMRLCLLSGKRIIARRSFQKIRVDEEGAW